MKDIKDYIHMYLGCEVAWKPNNDILEYGTLVGVSDSEVEPGRIISIVDIGSLQQLEWYVEETILRLRKLSSMTEDEAREVWDLSMEKTGYKYNHRDRLLASCNRIEIIAPVIPLLLSKGFDLFGLIDANLAIDKDTL